MAGCMQWIWSKCLRIRDKTEQDNDITVSYQHFQNESTVAVGDCTITEVDQTDSKIKIPDWVHEKTFGHERPGKLKDGNDIAICPSNGDIAVTDMEPSQVKIYDSNGQWQLSLDTTQGNKPGMRSQPWGIASSNQLYYVTDLSAYVKVFGAQGQFKFQFPAMSPDNKPSDTENTELSSIALDDSGHILIGGKKMKYISKHEQDGKHVNTIKINIEPKFLSLCPNGNIVVISWEAACVQIITPTGQLVHTLNSPPGVSQWSPEGVCCYDNTIFISVWTTDTSSHGIYCFSVTGEYLGCASNNVCRPCGLAITEDGKTLTVVDSNGVKLFKRK